MTSSQIFAISVVLAATATGMQPSRPLDRFPAPPRRFTAAPQACPEPGDFARAPSRPVELPAGPVNIWGAVREALTRWRDSSFQAAFNAEAQEAGPPYLAMETSPAVQMQQAPPAFQSAHTCFFEGRTKDRRNTDYRIAFWFAIRGAEGQKAGRILEVRWISGIKGSGERSWQAEVPQSGRQGEWLARRIEDQIK